ncbi:MAG: hypothetical protein NVSMB9_26380 [Isosphaeraceae bacterium]
MSHLFVESNDIDFLRQLAGRSRFRLRERSGQTDPHEEAGKGLGEMLSVRREESRARLVPLSDERFKKVARQCVD